MPQVQELSTIQGVYLVTLTPYEDERGTFFETFRKEWFPWRAWEQVQANRSESKQGVLRGLHFHHHQVDYWHVIRGTIRAGLCDLRAASPTYRTAQVLDLSGDRPMGLFIPVGVAHGFLALTDVTLTYVVDNYYDGGDEYGLAWDDPDAGVAWQVDRPLLSHRDMHNPRLRDIPAEHLPG